MDIHAHGLDSPVDHVLLDFLIPLVVPQQHDQRHLRFHRAGQFRQGELQAAVTDQAHRRRSPGGHFGAAQPGAHGSGQGIAEGAVTGRRIEPAAWMSHVQGQVAGVHRLGRIADQDGIGQGFQDAGQQARLAQGHRVPGRLIVLAQARGTRGAPLTVAGWLRLRLQGCEQRLGGLLGIGHQRQLGQVVTHRLVRVDIDAQQAAGDLEAALERHVVIGLGQLGADGQHHIGLGDQRTGSRQRLGRTDLQRVVRRQQPLGIDGQRHWRLQVLGQSGQRRASRQRTTPGENQWPTCLGQALGHLPYCLRRSARAAGTDGPRRQQVIGGLDQHVQRNLDMHRAWPRAIEHGKGPGQHLGQVVGAHQRLREGCHARDQGGLVGQLMQLAAPAAELAARLHAGDHQHRDRVGIGLAHGSGDIGHAWAGDDEAHPRFAACTRVAIGHEPGALLVTRGDVADGRRRQATVQLYGMHTGNTEDMVNAIVFEEFDQHFAAGCHDRIPESC